MCSFSQRRHQDLFRIGQEGGAIHGTIEDHGSPRWQQSNAHADLSKEGAAYRLASFTSLYLESDSGRLGNPEPIPADWIL